MQSKVTWAGSFLAALLLSAPVFGAEAGDDPAGPAELASMEKQIADMTQLLKDREARKSENQEKGVDLLYQTARYRIVGWTDYQAPLPQNMEQFQGFYLKAMADRDDFDPLAPLNAWSRSWVDLRRQEHQLNDQAVELRVALRHLERLRDRLREQLQLPPVGPEKAP